MSSFGSYIKINRYHESHIKLCKTGSAPISTYSPETFEDELGNTIRTYLIKDGISQSHSLQCDESDFTMEMWMKVEALGSGGTQFYGTGNGGWRWRMINNYENYELIIFDGVSPISADVVVNVGQWHHHAWTYDNSTQEARIYLDGNLILGPTVIGDVTHGASGHAWNCLDHSFSDDNNHGDNLQGWAAEFRIWHERRTQQQIQNNMKRQLINPASIPNLIAYWKPSVTDLQNYQDWEGGVGQPPPLEGLSSNGFTLDNHYCQVVSNEHPFL